MNHVHFKVVYDINGEIREAHFRADTSEHAGEDARLFANILERKNVRFRVWNADNRIIRQHLMDLQTSMGV